MDKVLVPVKLTEEMRERMAHIADGPLRTHDEVWAEMLDAAYTRPRHEVESIWMDMRHARADQLTAHVLSVIDKYICDHDREHNYRLRAARELFDLFYLTGAEVVSDERRADAGLPVRDLKGWTREELAIMEAKRIETMLRPIPPMIMPAPQ